MKSSEENRPPPTLTDPTLAEALRHSAVDVLLLCFFAVVLTTVALGLFSFPFFKQIFNPQDR